MNEQLRIQIEPSMGIVYRNTQRMGRTSQMTTTTALFQQLKDLRHELKQVKKERDRLKTELWNNIQIF